MQTIKIIDTKNTSSIMGKLKHSLILIASLALVTACSSANSNDQGLSDANIAAIVVGANNIDISAGKIALKRSNNTQVRQFAQTMITDHTSVLNAAVALVTKLGVTPVNNDLVASLSAQSKQHEKNLKTLSGKAFDKAYIDHEVAYHQAVIGVIEEQLIPSAQNAELKAMLVSVLPAFRAHLEHCQMIQGKI